MRLKVLMEEPLSNFLIRTEPNYKALQHEKWRGNGDPILRVYYAWMELKRWERSQDAANCRKHVSKFEEEARDMIMNSKELQECIGSGGIYTEIGDSPGGWVLQLQKKEMRGVGFSKSSNTGGLVLQAPQCKDKFEHSDLDFCAANAINDAESIYYVSKSPHQEMPRESGLCFAKCSTIICNNNQSIKYICCEWTG